MNNIEFLDELLTKIHDIRRITASDPDNIWCKQATIMLNELYKDTFETLQKIENRYE